MIFLSAYFDWMLNNMLDNLNYPISKIDSQNPRLDVYLH